MWIARDKDGALRLFRHRPHRIIEDAFRRPTSNIDEAVEAAYWDTYDDACYECMLDNGLEINLKWEDEPIEVSLVPSMLNSVQEKLAESADEYFDYVAHVQDIHPYDKEEEQRLYANMCWRWQDWNDIKYDHPSTWDLNFDDYINPNK